LALLRARPSSRQAAARRADCRTEAEAAVPWYPAVVVRPEAHRPAARVAQAASVLLRARPSSRQAAARRADCRAEAEAAVPWYPAVVVRLAARRPAARVARPALALLPAQLSFRRAAHRLAARVAQAASALLRARPSSRQAAARPRPADCRAE